MASPSTAIEFLDICRKSGVVEDKFLTDVAESSGPSPVAAAKALIRKGALTKFQASQLLAGKHKGLRFDRLKILDRIGSGGMGTVFLCEHLGLRKQVACKILPPDQAGDEGTRERFFREARAAAALDHPNIVRVFDTNSSGGVHYIVMEYVDGQDLQSIVNKYGPMPYARAVNYIAQAALGLQHAAEKKLVHRDIKPANLLVDKEGVVKILDMGLARFNTDAGDNLTAKYDKGAILGTADYMAPEQIISSSEVDIRADIYSLGATLYTLVNGKPPFSGTSTQKLAGHQNHQATSLTQIRREVPKALSAVVDKMMAKAPSQRYQTPSDVVDALTPWLEADTLPLESQQTRVVSSTSRKSRKLVVPKKTSQKKWIVIGAIAASALIFGGLGIWLLGKDDKPNTVLADNGNKNIPNRPIAPGNSGANPAPANSNPNPNPAPIPTRTIYSVDFSKANPFQVRYDRGNKVGETGSIPNGWYAFLWSKMSKGDIGLEDYQGTKAVALKTQSGEGSAEFLTSGDRISGVKLIAGREYLLRCEYANIGRLPGSVEFRVNDLSKPSKIFMNLPLSDGKFRTADFKFVAPEHSRYAFFFCHRQAILPEAFYVKSVQLIEVGTGGVEAHSSGNPQLYTYKTSDFDGLEVKTQQFAIGSQTRELPLGFNLMSWQENSVGELKFNKTDRALELRNLQGNSLMLFGPTVNLESDQEYSIEFEYKATTGCYGVAKAKEGEHEARDLQSLPPTATWQKMRLTGKMPRVIENNIRFEFHNTTADPSAVLSIRDIQVRQLGGIVSGGAAIYDADFTKVTDFDREMTRDRVVGDRDDNRILNGWIANCWSENDKGRVAGVVHQGSKAIALSNQAGSEKLSSQLFHIDTGIKGVVGQKYKARVTYAIDGDASASHVDFRHGGSHENSLGKVDLEPSGGAWRTVEAELTAKSDETLSVFVQNYRPHPQTPLYLKSIQIIDAGAPKAANTSMYRLDTNGVKTFARRMKGTSIVDSQGDGDLREPWTAHTVDAASEGDIFADTFAGSMAYGFRNHIGKAVRLVSQSPVAQMKRGNKYSVRVSYALETNGRGVLAVEGPDGEMGRFDLNGPAERWLDAEFSVSAKSNGPMKLQFSNGSEGSDSSVYVKMIDVREIQ